MSQMNHRRIVADLGRVFMCEILQSVSLSMTVTELLTSVLTVLCMHEIIPNLLIICDELI